MSDADDPDAVPGPSGAKSRRNDAAGRKAATGTTAAGDGASAKPPGDRAAERAARQERNKAEREARQAANRAARLARKQGNVATAAKPTETHDAQPVAADAGRPKARAKPAKPARPVEPPAPKKPAPSRGKVTPLNVLAIGQAGRLEREVVLLAASLRRNSPDFKGRLIVAEPQPTGAWKGRDTLMSPAARDALVAFGAEIVPLNAQVFGRDYPHGNKIEALSLLPAGEPFLFLDSDTVISGDLARIPFDPARPTASMRREGTWPEPPLYGPGYEAIWRSLYDRFGLDFAASLDANQPDEHWERYLYFNAGWFYGADPAAFGQRFLDWARQVRDDPNAELATQELRPWLDQVILPLVIHSLGGGRPGAALDGMDGHVTWHYRKLPLLYATAPDSAVETVEALAELPELRAVMADWPAWQDLVVSGGGRRDVRPLFDRDHLPGREKVVRQILKTHGFWQE